MQRTSMDLPEFLLRQIEAISPEPWYPSAFQQRDISVERLEAALDELRIAGLLHMTEWVHGRGRGYVLTPAGAQLLRNPGLVSRMRAGDILTPAETPTPDLDAPESSAQHDRAQAVAAVLTSSPRPFVTYALLGITLVWFLVGLALARDAGISPSRYLGFGDAGVMEFRHRLGGLLPRDVVPGGQWWRLLTHAFVHGGILNLLLGLWVLYSLASQGEALWGRARFLLLFFTSAWGGGVAVVLYSSSPMPVLGNGATLGGLIASACVWLLLNWSYMPRGLAGSWLRSIIANTMFLVLISFLPGADMTDLVGGAVAAGALAVPLVFQRFGVGFTRWLGFAGTVAAVMIAVGVLFWSAPDALAPSPDSVKLAAKADELINHIHERKLRGLLANGPKARLENLEKVKQVQKELLSTTHELREVIDKMPRGRAKDYAEAGLQYLELFKERCDPDANWTPEKEAALNRRYSDMDRLRARWRS